MKKVVFYIIIVVVVTFAFILIKNNQKIHLDIGIKENDTTLEWKFMKVDRSVAEEILRIVENANSIDELTSTMVDIEMNIYTNEMDIRKIRWYGNELIIEQGREEQYKQLENIQITKIIQYLKKANNEIATKVDDQIKKSYD